MVSIIKKCLSHWGSKRTCEYSSVWCGGTSQFNEGGRSQYDMPTLHIFLYEMVTNEIQGNVEREKSIVLVVDSTWFNLGFYNFDSLDISKIQWIFYIVHWVTVIIKTECLSVNIKVLWR